MCELASSGTFHDLLAHPYARQLAQGRALSLAYYYSTYRVYTAVQVHVRVYRADT